MCRITIYAASDSGLKRKEDQDSYAYRLTKEGSFHKKGILLAISEGMGGMPVQRERTDFTTDSKSEVL